MLTGDTHAIDTGKELVLLLFDKLVQVDRSTLFHTLKDQLHVDLKRSALFLSVRKGTNGKLETEVLVSLNDVKPTHDWSLVVGRSSSV
jgi:hypothetical protein